MLALGVSLRPAVRRFRTPRYNRDKFVLQDRLGAAVGRSQNLGAPGRRVALLVLDQLEPDDFLGRSAVLPASVVAIELRP